MRLTVRVVTGVLAAVLGALLALGFAAGTAAAAEPAHQLTHVSTQRVVAVLLPGAAASVQPLKAAPAAPVTTAPGTDYNKAQQQADSQLAKRKLIMAGVCVLLLVIVYFGHRAKYKHILRLKNLQNAKS